MDVNEANLTCPYCGASYRARDTTCPKCGKALSPTGYTAYGGEPEPPPTPPSVSKLAPPPPIPIRPVRRSRLPSSLRSCLGALGGVIIVAAFIVFRVVTSNSNSASYYNYTIPAMPPLPPTAVRPFACLPPPEATAYPLMPPAMPSVDAGLPAAMGTMAYLPLTSTPTQRPASLRVSYILNISTEKGLLQAKMYDIGASAANLPPVDHLRGALSTFSDGSVTIFTGNTIYADFTPTDLSYRCGSVLMLVSNGRVGGDQLTIIRSDDPAGALAFTQKYGFTYTVVGQLISGYDVLGALAAGDTIYSASVASSR